MNEIKTPPVPSGQRRVGNLYLDKHKEIAVQLSQTDLPQKQEYLTEVPEPPPNLEEMGKKRWNWLCRRMIEDKTLRLHWLAGIQELCQAYDFKVKLETALGETGILLQSPQGMPVMNPLIGQISSTENKIRSWLIELRLTPKSVATTSSAKQKTLSTIELPKSRKALVK